MCTYHDIVIREVEMEDRMQRSTTELYPSLILLKKKKREIEKKHGDK